jgi:hypothetical protein
MSENINFKSILKGVAWSRITPLVPSAQGIRLNGGFAALPSLSEFLVANSAFQYTL